MNANLVKQTIWIAMKTELVLLTYMHATSRPPFALLWIKTRSLGVEWGQYGIRMNCIAPGPIYTEGAFSRLDPSGTMINQAVKAIPTGRLGEVEEIANLATYMCSDYSSWLNSESVTFDGGEFRSLAGEFNQLRKVPKEMWDMMEQMIRSSNKKQKNKDSKL